MLSPRTQLAAAIRTKDLSPTGVVEASLSGIERLDPKLNAYCTVTANLAHATAGQAEAAIWRGPDS